MSCWWNQESPCFRSYNNCLDIAIEKSISESSLSADNSLQLGPQKHILLKRVFILKIFLVGNFMINASIPLFWTMPLLTFWSALLLAGQLLLLSNLRPALLLAFLLALAFWFAHDLRSVHPPLLAPALRFWLWLFYAFVDRHIDLLHFLW